MIELRTLGVLDLRDAGGRAVHPLLRQPKRLALLVYLCLARPRGFHRRDVLLALLWPESDTEHARASLRNALHVLRRALGEACLLSRGVEEVGVAFDRISCDATTFEEAAGAARLDHALELYRGDLLSGFFLRDAPEYERWLESERIRLRAVAAGAARMLADQLEGESNFTRAVKASRRALELAGPDERGLRRLMALLDRAGDHAGALKEFEAFSRKLASEYGAETARESRQLMERIRSPGAGSASDARADGPAAPRVPPSGALPPINLTALPEVPGYALEREIGRGGMSIVYLARELKHSRRVAIKVIRREVALSLGTERFLAEIGITARFAHPNILPLLDSGTTGGLPYYVMPFVDGQSLRQRLGADQRLPVSEAVHLASEIASALQYAHAQGLMHRDIKPENILLSGDHAVVADFGIASAITRASEHDTPTGGRLPVPATGSPAYMSPEQSAGSRHVDGRSDIYSLGCVLYELLAGRPPFEDSGDTGAPAREPSRMVARLRATRPDVPAWLGHVLARALAVDPDKRFASTQEFAAALSSPLEGRAEPLPERPQNLAVLAEPARQLHRVFPAKLATVVATALVATAGILAGLRWHSAGVSGTAPDDQLVAVLPFRVTAPDSNRNYLREGMVDLVSAQLTGNGLPRAVDSRAVLSAYRNALRGTGGEALTEAQSLALARRLGANEVLVGELVATSTGSVINARLLSVPSGRVIAEQSVSGTGDELVLVTRLTSRLLARSVGEVATRLSGLSDSTEAVRAYLSGMRAYRSGQVRRAFDEFGRALDIDSAFAPAALWRAYVSLGAFSIGWDERISADSVAWTFRKRVSRHDSLLLASLFTIGPNWPAVSSAGELVDALARAAQANPDRPEVWFAWARHLEAFGAQAGIPDHFSRAATADDSAIALDSGVAPVLMHRTYLALLMSDTTAARNFARLHARVNRDSGRAALLDWMVARALGDQAHRAALLDRLALAPGDGWRNVETWATYYGLSSLDEAERVAKLRLARSAGRPEMRRSANQSLLRIAATRGHPRLALSLADSLTGPVRPDYALITLSIAGPGFDDVAWKSVRFLEASVDTARIGEDAYLALCYAQLWRVSRGDTLTARRAVRRMRALSRPLDPAFHPRIGALGLCPALVEAGIAQRVPSRARPVELQRVIGILLGGHAERPQNLANLLVARWLASEGDSAAALAIIRHMDPMVHILVGTAASRIEGRLATAVGDTAGAIRAYERFLALRPDPDPGPLADEAQAVRRELSRLTNRKRSARARV